MNKLSARFSTWYAEQLTSGNGRPPESQVVVIGSGYGACVAALRYAVLGYEVTVLERGSEFVPGEFPADISALPTFFRINSPTSKAVTGRSSGLMNWHVGPGLAAMTGNGLGGGSLINAGIMIEPVAEVFGQVQWPAALAKTAGDDGISLQSCFDTAREMLVDIPGRQSTPRVTVQSADLPRSDAFRDMASRCHLSEKLIAVQATIDQDKCIRCGDCMTGCNVAGAKLTLTDTYLAHAAEQGAQILCGATVSSVRQHSDFHRWEVRVHPTELADLQNTDPASAKVVVADIVVIAAGTFGSTEILQRSREQHGLKLSPALGTRLSANGDSITVVANYGQKKSGLRAPPVNAVSRPVPVQNRSNSIGPTITQALDMRGEGPLQNQLLVEDGACPAPLARAFDALVSTQWVSKGLDRWASPALVGREFSGMLSDVAGAPSSLGDQSQILLTMGHDDSAGRIVWLPEINRAIPVWSSPQKLATYQTQEALFSKLDTTLKEARHLHSPLWRLLPESAGAMQGGLPDPMITTVHPLGGCVMGDDFETSVVNERGQVRRSATEMHHGLFVLDGSTIPTSLGCNPLLTITALAEYAMHFVPPLSSDQITGKARNSKRLAPPTQAAENQTTENITACVKPLETRPGRLPAVSAVFYERLFCHSLQPGPELATALGISEATANAEMILGFGHHDWEGAIATASHELNDITGSLKIQTKADKKPGSAFAKHTDVDNPVIEYQLSEGQTDADRSRFIILSGTAVDPRLNALPRRLYRYVMSWLTYLVQRLIPDVVRSNQLSKASSTHRLLHQHGTTLSRTLKRIRLFRDAAKLLWNASEARQMQYRLRFEPVNSEPGKDIKLPTLWITGHKHVQYAAGAKELGIYGMDLARRLWRWHRNNIASNSNHTAVLKPSYIEQVSNPRIDFHLAPPQLSRWRMFSSKPSASAQFQMDPYAVMQDKPPQIGQDGDLSAALVALSTYPALFARFALQTRLFDFRAPDYSGTIYRDDSPSEETTLFNRPEQPVSGHRRAQAFDIEVQRGFHAAEDSRLQNTKIGLRLWRYQHQSDNRNPQTPPYTRGTHNGYKVARVRSVLLLHAFSQSGLTYTFNTTRKNLAEAFVEKGYEVWVLESRMSTRLGLCDRPSTVDQIARFDVPGAVDFITRRLRDELLATGVLSADEQVQIACFGQCIGSASLAMAMLSGQLNHPAPEKKRPLSKLWSCMFSQVHPVTIGARESQAKSWIPPVLRLATNAVPFAVRGPVNNAAIALTDRILSSLPVPADETCPEHSDFSAHEDNVATCRRIRFIEAPLFKHRNLNPATHGILNKLFGNANLTLFAHARRFVDYELLVDENGVNRYVTTANIRNNMALPVAFLHGTDNELFDPDGARRSLELVRSVHPHWIQSFAPEVIPAVGYGHIDPLIGENADGDVYPRITGFFDSVLSVIDQDDSFQPTEPKQLTEVRYPRVGPFLGWTRITDGNDLLCRISGVVQMNSRAAIQADESGTSAWAYVPGVRSPDGLVPRLHIDRSSARTHVAWGDVRLPATRVSPGSSTVRIHLVVIHDVGRWAERTTMSRRDLIRLMWEHRKSARHARKAMQAPIPNTHSRRFSAHPGSASSFAGTEAVWRRPVVVRKAVLEQLYRPAPSQAFIIGCCRYPGIGIDRLRADAAFGHILSLLDDGPPPVTQVSAATVVPADVVVEPGPQRRTALPPARFTTPTLTLMLGDQIYADATAGMVDPATPVERYTERYESAFGVGKSPQIARLLRTMPVLMTPDDHEYYNGYPHEPSSADGDHDAAIAQAISDLHLFQSITNPNGRQGNYVFDCGLVRYCVIDTRSNRSDNKTNQQIRITAPDTMTWLQTQLTTAGERFICICTGSVVLPGLRDDGSPSNPIAIREGFEVARDEQRELLDLCITHASGRFALISGDYHIGSVVNLAVDNIAVGCAIVAPPFYAPFRYINAQPYELLEHDTIMLDDNRKLTVSPAVGADGEPAQCEGSGFGLVQVDQTANGWCVRVGMQLNQYERFTGWNPLQPVAQMRLGRELVSR
ncbi:MAG: GMC oxidoreductase [Burkholderiaceae bacterium]